MHSPLLERLELRDLLFFETIADCSHLGRASKELGRTQPALTRCVHRLEEALGARLFERVGRGIQLTPVGLLLLNRARVLRRVAEDTLQQVDDFEHGSSGHVLIGTGPITAERLLPAVCRTLLSQGKDITTEVVIGWNAELLGLLKEGNLDLVLGPVTEVAEDFCSCSLVEDVFVVAARARHRIFRKQNIRLQDLLAYRWVLPTQKAASRQWLDRTFELRGLSKPTVQIEANVISLLSSVIGESDLISFVSRHNLRGCRDGVKLREIPLKDTTMHRSLGVTWRKNSYLSPAAQRLVEAVRAQGATLFSAERLLP
jgi:DNA-binding transcriptional LysR family regulator